MSIDSESLDRIYMEVVLGREPSKPDTDAEARHRKIILEEVEQARKDGMILDVPSEWPDV